MQLGGGGVQKGEDGGVQLGGGVQKGQDGGVQLGGEGGVQ